MKIRREGEGGDNFGLRERERVEIPELVLNFDEKQKHIKGKKRYGKQEKKEKIKKKLDEN